MEPAARRSATHEVLRVRVATRASVSPALGILAARRRVGRLQLDQRRRPREFGAVVRAARRRPSFDRAVESHAGTARQLPRGRARVDGVPRDPELGRRRLGRQRTRHARARGRGAVAVPRIPAVDRADPSTARGPGAHTGTRRVSRARRSSPRPRLRALAERLGIVSEYVDMDGVRRRASDAAREELLAVMGFEAPTEDAALGWLAELDHEERETILAPVRVVERDDASARRVHLRLPPGVGSADVELTLTEE